MPTRVVVTIIVRGAEALRDDATPPPYLVDVEMEPAKRTIPPPAGRWLGGTTVRMGRPRRLLAGGVAALVAALLVTTAVTRHPRSDPELRGPLVGPPNVWSAAIPTTAAGAPPDPAADATSCPS